MHSVTHRWAQVTALVFSSSVFLLLSGCTDRNQGDSLIAKRAPGLDQPEQSPLVGKPAPAVELNLLDGGDFRLADHLNSSVVMIDFWATWCGPCVLEMPILAEVAREYKDKGVAFYAVNLRENPEQIRAFLEKTKLDITVALDTQAQTAMNYGVEGIPTLVLVDKSGTVRSVHVGYNPGIKDVLKRELDDLLNPKG